MAPWMRQLITWSLFGWVIVAVAASFHRFQLNYGWEDAFLVGCVYSAILLIGTGVTGLGGGGQTWTDPISRVAKRWERERSVEEAAVLTSFGAALFVVVQLALAVLVVIGT